MQVENVTGKLRFSNQGGVVFGDSVACNTILPEGWLAINTDTDKISVHDGVVKRGINTSYVSDPRSFILLGDSHNASTVTAPSQYSPWGDQQYAHTWVMWWMMATSWRYIMKSVLAVGGKRTDEVLNEQVENAILASPGFIIESTGTNDAIQNVYSIDQAIAYTKELYDKIINAGIGLRIYIAPMYLTGATVAKAQYYMLLREFKLDYAKLHPGVIVYDHFEICSDYASSTASSKAIYYRDGIHTSELAAYLGGIAFAQQDNSMFGSMNSQTHRYISPVGISGGASVDDLRQLFRFPGLPGSTAEGNTGMSGVRPANGWYGIRSGTGTGVGSLETAGLGWQRFNIAKSGAALNDAVTHGYGFGASDYAILNAPQNRRRLVQLSVVRKLTSVSGVIADNINLSLTINGVSKTAVSSASTNTDPTHYPNGIDRTLEYRTPILEIPAGGTVTGGSIAVGLKFGGVGSATDGIEQIQILDVSRNYDGL